MNGRGNGWHRARWFLHFLNRSVAQRRGRFLLSSAAVMLTVTSVTALVTVSSGIRGKIGAQLQRYGANVAVTDGSGAPIGEEDAARIAVLVPEVRGASYQVFGTVRIGTGRVEVIGRDLGRMSGYRMRGRLPSAPGEVLAGVRLRDSLGFKEGGRLVLNGRTEPATVTGFVESGSDEDSALFLPLAAAQELLGMTGVSAVLLSVDTEVLPRFERAVASAFPRLQTKVLMQVAVAEERLLRRVQLLMVLVTGVILSSSVIGLGSTIGASVIERMEEIGLMASLGASARQVRAFFLAEAVLAGAAGSVAGYLAGLLAAEAVAWTAFGGLVPVSPGAFPLAVVLGILISVSTAVFPVRAALAVAPSKVLRGE